MVSDTLILGGGFIGERLARELGCSLSVRRITCFKDIDEELEKFNPRVLINCVGHTGKNNVDDCELDIDRTLTANSFVPFIMAEAAFRRNIKFVHISSGCIFNYNYASSAPIADDAIPDFFGLFYSRSKIYAERGLEALSRAGDVLVVRIRIPLDDRPHAKNILDKLIRYRTVIDIPNSVTYVPDFLNALGHLLRVNAKGVYNLVNEGGLRYPELLSVYRKHVPDFEYKIIEYNGLNLVRTNLLLSVKKLKESGFKVRKISDVLEECVSGYLERKKKGQK